MERIILHLDMDAFFAAVEERDDPTLRGKPLVVAGHGKRSIVTTASYAARAFGVRTAMPLGMALRLCPSLTVVPVRHRRYAEVSETIMERLLTFTPDVEPASVDEAYIEGSRLAKRFGGAEGLARALKEGVREASGLTCSVGVAPNKLLAKLASGMDKPDGLTVILPRDIEKVLRHLPVKELCGIGPATTSALASLGIATCGELARYPVDSLTARFGSLGPELARMARGEDDSRVRPAHEEEEAKSVGHSVTLDDDITDRGEMERIIHGLAEKVGRRARKEGHAGRRVTLTIRYADFTTFSRQVTLPSPVSAGKDIFEAARGILREVKLAMAVRLLGVSISQWGAGDAQESLFGGERKRDRLQEALDRIEERFGEGAVRTADLVKEEE